MRGWSTYRNGDAHQRCHCGLYAAVQLFELSVALQTREVLIVGRAIRFGCGVFVPRRFFALSNGQCYCDQQVLEQSTTEPNHPVKLVTVLEVYSRRPFSDHLHLEVCTLTNDGLASRLGQTSAENVLGQPAFAMCSDVS